MCILNKAGFILPKQFFDKLCILLCPTRDQTCPILLSHTPHWCGFSQGHVDLWTTRGLFTLKALSCMMHWYSFSPVWIIFWFLTLVCLKKKRSNWLHSYGFSPVCILRLVLGLLLCVKALSHRLQLYGLYPECSPRCTLKLVFTWKLYHMCRVDMVSLQCVFSNAA